MKDCLVITRHAPYGTAFGKEGLDAVLMASAFTRVSLLFMDDGVFQLLQNQEPQNLHIKGYSPVFELLEQYEVRPIYVAASSLTDRALSINDLVIEPELVEDLRIGQLIEQHQFILTF